MRGKPRVVLTALVQSLHEKGMVIAMIGENLRYLRKGEKITQSELAKAIGVSTSAIGMYEQDRREPNDEILIKLCQYFKVPSDYFILGEPFKKSRQDLKDVIDDMIGMLKSQEDLMFNGSPVDKSDLEQLADAFTLGAEIVMNRLRHNKEAQHA